MGCVRVVGGRFDPYVGQLLKACHTLIVGTSVAHPYIVSSDIYIDWTLDQMQSIRQYRSD